MAAGAVAIGLLAVFVNRNHDAADPIRSGPGQPVDDADAPAREAHDAARTDTSDSGSLPAAVSAANGDGGTPAAVEAFATRNAAAEAANPAPPFIPANERTRLPVRDEPASADAAEAPAPAQPSAGSDPACWHRSRNWPGYNYAIARDRRVVFNGASSLRAYATELAPQAGSIEQTIDASEIAGHRIEFSAFLRFETIDTGVSLWLNAVDAGGRILGNVRSAWVSATMDWHSRSIVMDIPSEAAALTFAVALNGRGEVRVDDVSLEIVGPAELSGYDPSAYKGHSPVPDLDSLSTEPCNLDFENWGD